MKWLRPVKRRQRWVDQARAILRLAFLAGAVALLAPRRGHAQAAVMPIRIAIATPQVRNMLAVEWALHENDDPYFERAYCGRYVVGEWANMPAYIVTGLYAPDTILAQPKTTAIDFRCYGPNKIPIHVHPPRNCPTTDGPCTRDGLYAYQCRASDTDRTFLQRFGFLFGIVQCERRALITFWPDDTK